jgi:hypothetical protein
MVLNQRRSPLLGQQVLRLNFTRPWLINHETTLPYSGNFDHVLKRNSGSHPLFSLFSSFFVLRNIMPCPEFLLQLLNSCPGSGTSSLVWSFCPCPC